jgi:hypothetical protein
VGKKMIHQRANVSVTNDYTNRFMEELGEKELFRRYERAAEIRQSPIFIQPPESVDDSYRFGWMRGIALMTETMINGRWYEWLRVNAIGRLPENLEWPEVNMSMFPSGMGAVTKMMESCMKLVYHHGLRVDVFLEWIGYALGIAWFKKPSMPDSLWGQLYREFNLDYFYMFPSDYFSEFLAAHGYSGVADYFPTPLNITIMMNLIAQPQLYETLYEPCLGAAAQLLPSRSLNMIGTDLNPAMCKTAAIQAFLYQPALLYTPQPIKGIHFDEKEMRMCRYFEFTTNTRIYCGDSLMGEFTAPRDIFEENSTHIDVYLSPVDLEKREIYKFEEEMMRPWIELPKQTKWNIVVAQSREFGMDVTLSNPPFNMSVGKFWMENLRKIEEKNRRFLQEREQRLVLWREKYAKQPAAVFQSIEDEVNHRIIVIEKRSKNVVKGQLAFEFT